MSVQPNYEELKFYGEQTFYKQTEVECRVNASADIKNVVAVTGAAASVGEEIADGEVRYGGRVTFCVLYETAEGVPAKTECGVEFTDKYENTGASSVGYINYTVTGAEARFVNGGYIIQAVVNAEINVNKVNTVNVLTGGDDLLCDLEEKEIKTLEESGKSALQLDDEFDLAYPVKDVLMHTATICLSEVQSGIGAIILDGTVFLSLTLLQNNEKNVIVKENRAIPFRLEAEMRSASPEMQAAAFLSLSKCAIKVVVDEEKDTSAVIASFDMDCYGSVYSGKTVRLARDAYSVKNEVGVTVSGFTNRFVTAQYGTAEKISGSTDHEFTDGAEIVAVVGERIENVGLNADNNLISGVISATVIEASENGYSGKRAAVPFEVPFAGNKSTEYAICAAIENFGYRLRNTLDFDAAIRFSVTEKVTEQYTAVSEISVGDEKTEKTTAISVYIAKGNDTLWDVCKELGVSAEVIAELNPEVTFPLTGAERIIVYRNM